MSFGSFKMLSKNYAFTSHIYLIYICISGGLTIDNPTRIYMP